MTWLRWRCEWFDSAVRMHQTDSRQCMFRSKLSCSLPNFRDANIHTRSAFAFRGSGLRHFLLSHFQETSSDSSSFLPTVSITPDVSMSAPPTHASALAFDEAHVLRASALDASVAAASERRARAHAQLLGDAAAAAAELSAPTADGMDDVLLRAADDAGTVLAPWYHFWKVLSSESI